MRWSHHWMPGQPASQGCGPDKEPGDAENVQQLHQLNFVVGAHSDQHTRKDDILDFRGVHSESQGIANGLLVAGLRALAAPQAGLKHCFVLERAIQR